MNKRQITPQLFSEYLRSLVSLLVMGFLTPLLLHHLGNVQFGIWVTFSAMVGYFGVFDLGLGFAAPKLFAEQLALGDQAKMSRTFSTLFLFFLAGGLLAVGSIALFSLPLERFLNIPEEWLGPGRMVLLILSVGFSVSFLANIWYGFLFGAQKLHISNGIGILSLLLLVGSVFAVLEGGFGLVGVAWANLAVNMFGWLAAILYVRKHFPGLKLRLNQFDRGVLQFALGLSLFVFVSNIGGQIIYNADNLVISKFLGVEKVAAYAIALRLCLIAIAAVFSFSKLFLPVFSHLQATRDVHRLGELFLKSSRTALALGIFLGTLLLLYGEKIIHYWTGPSSFVGRPAFYTLALLLFTTPAIQTGAMALLGMGRIKVSTAMCLAEALCNIALSIALARRWGVFGVALGTLLAQAATNAWFVPFYTLRQLGLRKGLYFKEAVGKGCRTSAVPVALSFLLYYYLPPQTLVLVAAEIGVLVACFSISQIFWIRRGN